MRKTKRIRPILALQSLRDVRIMQIDKRRQSAMPRSRSIEDGKPRRARTICQHVKLVADHAVEHLRVEILDCLLFLFGEIQRIATIIVNNDTTWLGQPSLLDLLPFFIRWHRRRNTICTDAG